MTLAAGSRLGSYEICFDSDPARLLIKDLQEDFDFGTTDLVQLLIDSLHDGRSGFTLVVNPGGARRDLQVSNNGTTNQDWDGVWDAKVSRNDEAWFVEYMIPFKTLRFSQSPSQEWGLNISRRIMHRNEESNPVTGCTLPVRLLTQGVLQRLHSIQCGHSPGELQHPFQRHPPPTQRSLRGV